MTAIGKAPLSINQRIQTKMKISERVISITALAISLASAAFSYLQFNSSEKQLLLNAQQLRPHISYVPTFFPLDHGLRIDMYLQNQSPLPANVLYTETVASLDGKFVSHDFHSTGSDILYQEKAGVSTLPLITGKSFGAIVNGSSTLQIATCAVYASTNPKDPRRWITKALNEYLPGTSLPMHRSVSDEEVQESINQCDADTVFRN